MMPEVAVYTCLRALSCALALLESLEKAKSSQDHGLSNFRFLLSALC